MTGPVDTGIPELVYTPAPTHESFVELAQAGQGRIFKKMIFRGGDDFVDPRDPLRKKKIKVTPEFGAQLAKNFADGMCDIVQVPIVDGKNAHTEDPLRNMGQVIDLESQADGTVYAFIDARKKDHADELGKTLIGASAMFHPDYTDTKTGKHVGPTLLHVAVTNRPFITQLDGYEELVAASAADNTGDPIFLATTQMLAEMDEDPTAVEEQDMPAPTKDEMIAALKADGYSVLTADELATATAPAAVPAAVTEPLKLSATETAITIDDVAEAVVELSGKFDAQAVELSAYKAREEKYLQEKAEGEVDGLIGKGRILPKSREVMIELSMHDRDKFEALLPADAIVELSETGVTTHDAPANEGNVPAVVDSYVERMTHQAKK